MDTRTDFLLQLLQKLGAPLMVAVNAHAPAGDDAQTASAMAGLLSESVQIGLGLTQALNLKTGEGDPDAVRVAMATVAGNIVAENYKQTGRVPGEADRARIQKAIESVIVFADNFAPAAEHAKRLKTLDNTPPFFDPVQANIYTIHALLPVIAAAGDFSFGQEAPKLLQETAQRLGARAREIQGRIGAGPDILGELVTLEALSRLFAGAYGRQVARLQSGGEGAGSLENVWKDFDAQAGMVEILLSSMAGNPAQATGQGGGGGVRPHHGAEEGADQYMAGQAAPGSAQQAPQAPSAQTAPAQQTAPPANPAAEGSAPASAAPAAPPPAAQGGEQPPAAPPAIPPAAMPPPAGQPPAQGGAAPDPSAAPPEGGSPMSFFKKK
ncbi:MAG: hypothetical protein WC989_06905 [Micavibrio sp.]